MSSIIPSKSRKQNKSNSVNHVDCIGELPDDVLSLVFSRMPIKDVVRTCVLSKDWKFKWTSITELNINIEDYPRTNVQTFLSIVERVLSQSHMLNNLSLSCSCPATSESRRIGRLISAILRRNIRRLSLVITGSPDFVLSFNPSNCASLAALEMHFGMPCRFKIPVNNYLPELKSLSLGGVLLNEVSNTDTLVLNLPVLEVLELIECKWGNVKFVSICAPKLHTFISETPYEKDKYTDYSIKVHGAKITLLAVCGGYPENITLIDSTVDNFVLKSFDHIIPLSRDEYGLRVVRLLREVSTMKRLCMTGVVPAIGEKKLELPLPRYCNLKVMHLCCPIHNDGLLELLNASPCLEELELWLSKTNNAYDLPEKAPSCIVHHLEKLTICYDISISPLDYDYLIEKYLLKNGEQLKTLLIQSGDEDFPEKDTVEIFENFPRASICLKIASENNVVDKLCPVCSL